MKKHLFATIAAITLFLPSFSTSLRAEPSEHADSHHSRFSPEDSAAFTDARIAALKAGLKLTPTQEKNWPALETAIRDQAKARAARMTEMRGKKDKDEDEDRRDAIERLRTGAKHMAARATELEKLADAAKPLYDSLDEAQKRRFGPLLRIAIRGHGHHGMHHGGRRGGDAD